ncbi:MAG: hypothetical protein AB8H47_19595 [Bacteroidia bacterium]
MLKRIFSIFAIYFALIPLTTIPACEDWLINDIEICDIQFTAAENSLFQSGIDSVATFEDDIVFVIYANHFGAICWQPKLELVSTAVATTICYRYTNSLLQASYELTFDRPFAYQGDTIPAGTNLFMQPSIASQIETTLDSNCDFYSSFITFTPALRNACVFEKGEYEAIFSCESSDDKAFTDSTRVIFMP